MSIQIFDKYDYNDLSDLHGAATERTVVMFETTSQT